VLRILCKRQNAGLVCTELTSSHGLYYGNEKTYRFLRWTEEERPISAQIFGADPHIMEQAARAVCDAGADVIDINMGCWVPKVAKTGAGAALLKDIKRAAAVMSAVVRGASVPVTVKTRVGWDGCTGSAVELARVAEDVGVAGIAVHGRFARQGFDGHADWRPIAEVKEAVSIPVMGNGDVRTPQDAARMFEETACDGVMIGRAALGDPWIFRRTLAHLETGVLQPEPGPVERSRWHWSTRGCSPGRSADRIPAETHDSPAASAVRSSIISKVSPAGPPHVDASCAWRRSGKSRTPSRL
jgi:tRNA-dihydrouridine synthase B